MTKLKIADGLELPIDAGTQTFAILGIRGSGKTNTAVSVAEEMLKLGQQISVLDPTDGWWGLRSSKDGRSEGFKVIVVGGEHGDIPLEGTGGKLLAEFVVETGASVVFSLRHLSINDQRRFAADFAERLYELKGKPENRTALHIFVDEADEFIPQRIPPGHERMFGAFDRLVRRGRNSGIGLTMISQRPQVLNKDTLSQCETLICHRLLHKLDRKAVKEGWVEGHDTGGKATELMDSLASLGRGDAWVWSPYWLDLFKRVHIRERGTFDSSFTPKAGERPKKASKLADVDLDALKQKLSATIEKAKADDPKELRKRIAELERELAKKPATVAAVPAEPIVKEKLVEVPWIENKILFELNDLSIGLQESAERLEKAVIGINMPELKQRQDAIRAEFAARTAHKTPTPVRVPTPVAHKPLPVVHAPSNGNGNGKDLRARILRTLAEWEALGHTEIKRAALSGLAQARGGYYENTVSRMKSEGLLDYPSAGMVALTVAGRSVAPKPEAAISNMEMYGRVRNMLKGLEVRIFDQLWSAYPTAVDRERLSELVEAKGGYYENTVSKMKTREFIDYPDKGKVRAADWLFVER